MLSIEEPRLLNGALTQTQRKVTYLLNISTLYSISFSIIPIICRHTPKNRKKKYQYENQSPKYPRSSYIKICPKKWVSESIEELPVLSHEQMGRCLEPLDLKWRKQRANKMQFLRNPSYQNQKSFKYNENIEEVYIRKVYLKP